MSRKHGRGYVPALGFHALTRFYDPVVRLTLKDDAVKARLARELAVVPGMRVVDIGCGPGSFAVRLARESPRVEIIGVDGDAEVLGIARRKAHDAGVDVQFLEGMATELPVAAESADRVVMSLVLHHLLPVDKRSALRAAFDVLRPGGELHVVDWGKASDVAMRALFFSIQLLDGFPNTRDHVAGRLPAYLRDAGFKGVEESHRERTVYGTLSFYRGTKP